jgi:hypothetical protein
MEENSEISYRRLNDVKKKENVVKKGITTIINKVKRNRIGFVSNKDKIKFYYEEKGWDKTRDIGIRRKSLVLFLMGLLSKNYYFFNEKKKKKKVKIINIKKK